MEGKGEVARGHFARHGPERLLLLTDSESLTHASCRL